MKLPRDLSGADLVKTADTSGEEWELVLNLCRIFPLKITFPDITRPEWTIRESDIRILSIYFENTSEVLVSA